MSMIKFITGYILILLLSGLIYGCGDTVSQSTSGGGSNSISTGKGDSAVITIPESSSAEGGDASVNAARAASNPQNCPVQPPIHPTCSVTSQLNCGCVLPN